jgi:predicted RNA binding protein with dsRBD fold (UPF0201 family)
MNPLNFKTKEEMDSKIETMKEVTKEFGTEVKLDLAKLKDITKILEDDFSGESIVKVLKEFDNHENIMVEMVKNASFIDGINFIREHKDPQAEDVLSELMVSAIKVSVFLEKMAGILKSIDLLDNSNPRFVVDLVKAKLDAIQLNIKVNQIKGYVNGIQWVITEENDEINELLKNI